MLANATMLPCEMPVEAWEVVTGDELFSGLDAAVLTWIEVKTDDGYV